tara:strand:- start:6022 stop:7095 length:1074 start_codon:yes stop_codon:yes gene_type:complete
MNVGCMIYHYGERYEQLGRCARDSFARFHPDVTLHHVDEIKEREYIRKVGPLHTECKGIFKYMLAYEIMIKHEYDKMIILGGDTITCGRLNEFLDNDEDILTTLCMPTSRIYPFYSPRQEEVLVVQTRSEIIDKKEEHYSYNADVVCFNNPVALKAVIDYSLQHKKALSEYGMKKEAEALLETAFNAPVFVGPQFFYDDYILFLDDLCERDPNVSTIVIDYYAEQAGLNIVTTLSEYNKRGMDLPDFNFTVKCVDDPHNGEGVIYNVRSKGDTVPGVTQKPWEPYIKEFYVKDNKLYTGKDKQIKVWHYAEALGSIPKDEFDKLLDCWINKWFNQETKNFFTNDCNCGDFFTERGFE